MRIPALAPLLAVLAAGACASQGTTTDRGGGPAPQPDHDWSAVAAALRAEGRLLPDGTYRVDVPRKDPSLRNEFGFVVPPSMVLTYAAFAGSPGDATVMGDTCALGEEVNPVVDALRAGDVEVVAVHNHMLGGEPNFVFVHFQGRGDALALASTVRSAWDQLGRPHPQPRRELLPPPALDTAELRQIMRLAGATTPDGTYKVALARPRLATTLDGRPIPGGMGPACWVGFAPCECGSTMIMGDTCVLRGELQSVIDGYRRNGIRIVAIHNHSIGTVPELVFCHFAAEGDAATLARAVRSVWDGLEPPEQGR